MAHAPHSFRAINVFIQHTRYEIVFVLRWELVAMCSGAQKVTGVLWFREQLPQNMTRVGRDGPTDSLVCIVGHVSDGLSITREEPFSAEPQYKSFHKRREKVQQQHVSFVIQHLTGWNVIRVEKTMNGGGFFRRNNFRRLLGIYSEFYHTRTCRLQVS